jgi:ABC-type multidrug transport system fused ATPase/permease subunit
MLNALDSQSHSHCTFRINIRTLRKTIALVEQTAILFSGTIADNISFAKPDATIAEIQEAAKIVYRSINSIMLINSA